MVAFTSPEMNPTSKAQPGQWLTKVASLLPLIAPSYVLAAGPGSSGVSSVYLLKLFLALVFVLLIFLVLAKVVRQMNGVTGSASSGPLSIIASLSVGSRERIVILKVGEEQLLVGISPAGIVKLHNLDEAIEAEGLPLSNSFKSQLNSILGDRFK